MDTLREVIMRRVEIIAKAVPGIDPLSCTRERASAVQADECPALDVAPESDDPEALGAGLDRRDLTLRLRVFTAGNAASALADPFVQDFHVRLLADADLEALGVRIQPGGADFDRDDADQIVGRSTQRFRLTYCVRRGSLS